MQKRSSEERASELCRAFQHWGRVSVFCSALLQCRVVRCCSASAAGSGGLGGSGKAASRRAGSSALCRPVGAQLAAHHTGQCCGAHISASLLVGRMAGLGRADSRAGDADTSSLRRSAAANLNQIGAEIQLTAAASGVVSTLLHTLNLHRHIQKPSSHSNVRL